MMIVSLHFCEKEERKMKRKNEEKEIRGEKVVQKSKYIIKTEIILALLNYQRRR